MHHEGADTFPAWPIAEIDLILHISADDRCPTTIAQRTVCKTRVSLAAWRAWKDTLRETRPDLSVQSALLHGHLPCRGCIDPK